MMYRLRRLRICLRCRRSMTLDFLPVYLRLVSLYPGFFPVVFVLYLIRCRPPRWLAVSNSGLHDHGTAKPKDVSQNVAPPLQKIEERAAPGPGFSHVLFLQIRQLKFDMNQGV